MRHRPSFTPATRIATVFLSAFVALTSIGGGLVLLLAPARVLPPTSLLQHTPFASFTVPAVLLLAIGVLAATCASATWERSRSAVDLALLAGGAQLVWVIVEVAMLRELDWLQVVSGGVGLAIVGLGIHAAIRSHSRRRRWTVYVTAAETLGYLAPAIVGIAATRAEIQPSSQLLALTAAGFVEGFALGSGQARALTFDLRRLRFALLTGAGAAVMWASVMAMQLAPNPGILAPWIAVVGLFAIGGAQWLELRHHGVHAVSWLGWTALAWVVALPLSFLPGAFVDTATPISVHLALWPLGGLLMAYVMSLLTWPAARRAEHAHHTTVPPVMHGVPAHV